MGVSVLPGPKSFTTCSSVRWQWRAEMLTTSFGSAFGATAACDGGTPRDESTISRTIRSIEPRSRLAV